MGGDASLIAAVPNGRALIGRSRLLDRCECEEPLCGLRRELIEFVTTMKALHRTANPFGSIHPTKSAETPAGADNVRRRLSNIFHSAMRGSLPLPRLSPAASLRPRIHGSNCQSPRAHRC